MKVVSPEEMRAIDARAIQEIGIPSIVLMEHAGLQTVLAMERYFGCMAGRRVLVVCGKGNNGGDGMVTARHLSQRGAEVRVVLLGHKTAVSQDCRVNMEIVLMLGIDFCEVERRADIPNLVERLEWAEIVVDAIFGTGLRATPRQFYLEVIREINRARKRVVAVDMPTGLGVGDGREDSAVRAELTVTFALPKLCHVCGPGVELVGKLEVVDIGIPAAAIREEELKVNLVERELVARMFRPRAREAHKGAFGHVLVIAGSSGKTGAAVLAATAALRVGAGLVTLAVPESVHHIVETKTTEVMSVALPETEEHTVSYQAERRLCELIRRMDVVAIGPGLTTHPETVRLVNEMISSLELPIVADADALNAISLSTLRYAKRPLIITPHPGEMARLLEISSQEVQHNRLEAVQRTAQVCNTIVVLKGHCTLVADPQGNVYVNPTGNPGMATAGTGDVLTGMIAGLLAQGLTPVDAAVGGVYVHGLAGDLAVKSKGEMGLIASDVLEMIPQALLEVARGDRRR